MNQIPDYVKAALWSYDIDKLDLNEDKKSIVFSVLNYGSEKACKWLFSQYDHQILKNIFENSLLSSWNKKSLKLWSVVFETSPKIERRPFL